MKVLGLLIAVLVILCACTDEAAAATATAGQATFQVTTKTANGRYAPRHVLAIWVTDAQGNFVKTLKRQAATRQQYLYKFWASAKNYTPVDGTTGATLTSHTSHTVTWDCRNTNGVVMPDGFYYFNVEFTEENAQGPWTGSTLLGFEKSTAPITNAFNNIANFINMRIVFAPVLHDVGIAGMFPDRAPTNTVVPVIVMVTNNLGSPETFTLTLSNRTSNALIGAKEVTLAAAAGLNVSFDWDTAGLAPGEYQLVATAGPIPGETAVQDNQLVRTVTLRPPQHDLAITRFTLPGLVLPNSTTNISLVLTNRGDFDETAAITVTDDTDRRELVSQLLMLEPAQETNLIVSWNTAATSLGTHLLTARIAPVPGETITADNTLAARTVVAQGLSTNVLVARGSVWRYNDTGTDLTDAPWKLPAYYDGFWDAGQSPLGYDNNGIRTTLGFGPSETDKFITYYFRHRFMLDIMPTSLKCRILRDDGVVVYLNGAELMRDNMPDGAVSYSTRATTAVSGADETRYFEFNLPTDRLQDLVLGENLLAVEVHQSAPTSSDLSFDLELEAVQPAVPAVHELVVIGVEPESPVRQGDVLHVDVTVTNRGNVSETFRVDLVGKDIGQPIARRDVGPLPPGGAVLVPFDWSTHAIAPGLHTVVAYTVRNGLTNMLGAAEGIATILPALADAETVNVQGMVAGRSTAVSANDRLVLVGAGTTLEVMARLPDGMPSRVGGLRLPGTIEAVDMVGSYAFVACGPKGLQVVDLANPSQPALVASVPLPGHAYDVQAVGQIVCVAAGQAGLRVFDVTQPMAPAPVGTFLAGGPLRAAALAGQTALVLDAHAGLLVLDLSTPSAPLLKGAQPAIYAGTYVAVAGQTAFVTDARGFFWVVNLTTPDKPEITSRISMPGLCHGIGVAPSGGHVYVACDAIGVITAELTGSGARLIATNTLSGSATDLAVNGPWMYVAAGFAGLETWSLANPPVPSPAGVVPIGLRAVQPVIAGSLAYVAAGELGLHIYSLADAVRPRLVGSLKGLVNARAVAVQRNLAVVADGPCGVRIIDVSNPLAPRLVGTFTNSSPAWIRAVALSGHRVAATDGTTLSLIDVTNPTVPVLLDQVKLDGYAFALAMDIEWLAVSAGSTGLQFYNIAGDRLELAATYPTPGPAMEFAWFGRTACVACGPAGWLLLDISDPGSPQPIKLIPSTGLASSAAVSRALVFMANGAGTVISVENSAPLNPLDQKAFGPLVRALAVAANDRVALVAEDDAGMAVLAPVLAEPYALAMFNIVSESDRTVTVQWRSEQGKTYTLHRSFDLRAGFTPIARGLVATPPLNTFSDTVTADVAFYMVSIE
ncbi:MAG: DUF2271 domain-containing protein [Verrucomicrobia bacterium]|nr:DUF2271 domain-containing protein [Verrucomicrobiota bacterium]